MQAVEVLTNSPGALSQERAKVQYLLVDEFQDDNPVQVRPLFGVSRILYSTMPHLFSAASNIVSYCSAAIKGFVARNSSVCSCS